MRAFTVTPCSLPTVELNWLTMSTIRPLVAGLEAGVQNSRLTGSPWADAGRTSGNWLDAAKAAPAAARCRSARRVRSDLVLAIGLPSFPWVIDSDTPNTERPIQ